MTRTPSIRHVVLVVGLAAGCDSSRGNSPGVEPYGCSYSSEVMGRVCVEPDVPEADACGNGIVEGSEQCDGIDLHGATCGTLTKKAMAGGALSCAPDCTYDKSQCSALPSNYADRACGTLACEGLYYPMPSPNYAACCPGGAASNQCGIDLRPLEDQGLLITPECQAKAQPGSLDSSCPSRPFGRVTLQGCCRPDGTCGALMDTLVVPPFQFIEAGLGCVTAAALPDAGAPIQCHSPSALPDAAIGPRDH